MSLRLCIIAAAATAASAISSPSSTPLAKDADFLGLFHQEHVEPAVASAEPDEPSPDSQQLMLADTVENEIDATLMPPIPISLEQYTEVCAVNEAIREVVQEAVDRAATAAELVEDLERLYPRQLAMYFSFSKEALMTLRDTIGNPDYPAFEALTPAHRDNLQRNARMINWDKLVEYAGLALDSEKLAELAKEVFHKEIMVESFEIFFAAHARHEQQRKQKREEQLLKQKSDEQLPVKETDEQPPVKESDEQPPVKESDEQLPVQKSDEQLPPQV